MNTEERVMKIYFAVRDYAEKIPVFHKKPSVLRLTFITVREVKIAELTFLV